ncbi:Y-box-binding protein 2-like [Ornithodoros turicata]|uniref:Y-box-binding protein 2-like n=1 Tax=Ornithodoros turicata TaxID=34597 RepID=UPI003138B12A
MSDSIKTPLLAEPMHRTVTWFDLKNGCGFINRNDTHEDVFVHRRFSTRNNPQRVIRSLGDSDVVKFDVVLGDKVREAANVTLPDNESVPGDPAPPLQEKKDHPDIRRLLPQPSGPMPSCFNQRICRGIRGIPRNPLQNDLRRAYEYEDHDIKDQQASTDRCRCAPLPELDPEGRCIALQDLEGAIVGSLQGLILRSDN